MIQKHDYNKYANASRTRRNKMTEENPPPNIPIANSQPQAIGVGNGFEVIRGEAAYDHHAEISCKVLNGRLMGTNSALATEVSKLDYLKEAMKEDTSITGGLIATTTVHLKQDGVVKSGIDGTNNPVGFFTGASGIDRYGVPLNPKTLLNKDGSGHLANGKIKWDKKEDEDGYKLSIEGTIKASTGQIGNFEIRGDGEIVAKTDEGIDKLIITDRELPSVNSIGNGSFQGVASADKDSRGPSYGVYEQSETGFTASHSDSLTIRFNVPDTKNEYRISARMPQIGFFYDIQSPTHTGFPVDEHASITVRYKKVGESSYTNVYVDSRTGFSNPIMFRSTGDYELILSIYASVGIQGQNSGYIDFFGMNLGIAVRTSETVNYIGIDGMCSIGNPSNYFFWKESEGFEVRTGPFGLKCTTAGIQKFNGQNWVAANI
jgi:hypothetical protein